MDINKMTYAVQSALQQAVETESATGTTKI